MRLALTSFVSFLFLISLARPAKAETITCGAGEVECLIAAINQANADPKKTTIRLAAGTYLFSAIDNDTDGPNALPSIVSPIRIHADGATLARTSGSLEFRIFHVGPTGDLTLNGLTVTRGAARANVGALLDQSGGALLNRRGHVTVVNGVFYGNDATSGAGGAILNEKGILTIRNSTIARNDARVGGGGLMNASGVVIVTETDFDENHAFSAGGVMTEGGEVHISESRFLNNLAPFGAGGLYVSGGTVSIVGTTFTANVSQGPGGISVQDQTNVIVRNSAFVENQGDFAGAIGNGGTIQVTNTTFARNRLRVDCDGTAIGNSGTMALINTTFVDNIALGPSCEFTSHSVIDAFDGLTLLQNSIVQSSTVQGGDNVSFVQDCTGVVTSLGNNLLQTGSGCDIHVTDLFGKADLGLFTDDGLPGHAHFPLLLESQAIDAANGTACPKKDQIGQPRRPRCDIGAVEFRQKHHKKCHATPRASHSFRQCHVLNDSSR